MRQQPAGQRDGKVLLAREFEGWISVVPERRSEPCPPPPAAPISFVHLHSSGSQGFWQAFHSSFYWFLLSCPFRGVGKAQSLKEKKTMQQMHHALSPCSSPFPLPQLPRRGRMPHAHCPQHSSLFSQLSTAYPACFSQDFQAIDTSSSTCSALIALPPARKQFGKDPAQVAISSHV